MEQNLQLNAWYIEMITEKKKKNPAETNGLAKHDTESCRDDSERNKISSYMPWIKAAVTRRFLITHMVRVKKSV